RSQVSPLDSAGANANESDRRADSASPERRSPARTSLPPKRRNRRASRSQYDGRAVGPLLRPLSTWSTYERRAATSHEPRPSLPSGPSNVPFAVRSDNDALPRT